MTEQEQRASTNEELTQRFLIDAVLVMERSMNTLEGDDQRRALGSILSGGEVEVRVRLRRDRPHGVSIALIDATGEWVCKVAGGGA